MNLTSLEAETLLAIDIGSTATRAMLFDVAEGRYHFVATGQAPTTAGEPYQDVGEGVRHAIESLQKITGRLLIGKDEQVLIPTQVDGTGVDALVATLSAGPALNVVTVGLLDEVSLESAQQLASSTYGQVVESIGLNDHRAQELQVDAIIKANPDLVIIAGGTDEGAARSIARLVEVVGLACYLIPAAKRPVLLYAGNAQLAEKIRTQIEPITPIRIAPNIRPSFEHENLGPAQACLNEITLTHRAARINGVSDLVNLSNGHIYSTAYAFGRMIRYLSKIYDTGRGVLGVDLGSGAAVLATSLGGDLSVNTHRPLGMGEGLQGVLKQIPPAEIAQWLSVSASLDDLQDYLYQKAAFPGSLPVTVEELAMEQAVARAILQQAVKGLLRRSISKYPGPGAGVLPYFEPILAAGAVFTQAPTPAQVVMMLLDGLQPSGVTTLVLDQNNLTPALGALAGVNAVLPVQVMESGAYINLGTVVSPISRAPEETPLLNARMVYEDNHENVVEIKQGSLYVLPLNRGETAHLYLEPIARADLGLGKTGRGVKITGGALGAIIDARGRPLRLPADEVKRLDFNKKWLWTLGG